MSALPSDYIASPIQELPPLVCEKENNIEIVHVPLNQEEGFANKGEGRLTDGLISNLLPDYFI